MKEKKILEEEIKNNLKEVPNKTTIKAMKDKKLFSAETADEMIADCLEDPNWRKSE